MIASRRDALGSASSSRSSELSSHHCGAVTGILRPFSERVVAVVISGAPGTWPKPTETWIGLAPAVRQTKPPVACADVALSMRAMAKRYLVIPPLWTALAECRLERLARRR